MCGCPIIVLIKFVHIYYIPVADLVALGVSASVLSGSLTIDLRSVHTGLSRC